MDSLIPGVSSPKGAATNIYTEAAENNKGIKGMADFRISQTDTHYETCRWTKPATWIT